MRHAVLPAVVLVCLAGAAQADADAGGYAREMVDDLRQQDEDRIGAAGDDEFAFGCGGIELVAVEGVAEGVHGSADAAADIDGVGGGGETAAATFEQGISEGGAEAAERMANSRWRKG